MATLFSLVANKTPFTIKNMAVNPEKEEQALTSIFYTAGDCPSHLNFGTLFAGSNENESTMSFSLSFLSHFSHYHFGEENEKGVKQISNLGGD